jgi:protein pelota
LWHAYNLISEGDEVRATAVRRIVSESATGSTDSHRIRLNLTIRVDKIIFSADAQSSEAGPATQGTTSTLHLSGPITQESPHVKMGAYHTLDLEVGRDFTVIKGPGEWDSVNMDRVQDATLETKGAEVGAVIAGEGMASICLITEHTTLIRQRIDVSVPRKRKGGGTAAGAEKVRIWLCVCRPSDPRW